MANYLIAGGTGFVGKHLTTLLLNEKNQVSILTTQKNKKSNQVNYFYWNPSENYIDPKLQLPECILINLAGAGVAEKRWTNERKKVILESRIQSLETLFLATKSKQINPTHIISASAIGYYGDGSKMFTEHDLGDDSFLSTTCKRWEDAALKFESLGISTSIVRIGIVLGLESGALAEFIKPMRFGIAGIPSNGKQIYSWIDVHDLVRIIFFLSTNNVSGIYNGVAPNPCSINQIFDELKKYNKIFFTANAPSFILKLLLGEMAIEVLKSSQVSSQKIQNLGFKFRSETIAQCIENLYAKE